MILRAMPISKRPSAALLTLAALLAGAVPTAAQVGPETDAADVAKTPLRDLNIDARDIPEVLKVAAADPYADAGLRTCNAIVTEIAALDQVLGADYDIAVTDEKGGMKIDTNRAASGIVGSVIPFRGLVREVTGAAEAEREVRAAYTAGMVRRAFLKGLGMGRGCKYPARPAKDRGEGRD